MSRIATNIAGIERALLNRMAEANAAAAMSTLRMATMKKINDPRDDPAAFVTLSGFQTQLTNATAAMSNVTAAGGMITQAGTAVGKIADQLDLIRDQLLDPQSDSQTRIDATVAEINRLVGTDIGGRRLLDGSADFEVSGVQSSEVAQVSVYSTRGGTETISGSVVTAAEQATLRYTGVDGQADGGATITITGNRGSAEVTVTDQQPLVDLADQINAVSHLTGVTASADGDNLDLLSVGYGEQARVSVEVAPGGTFPVTGGDGQGTDYGTNGTAVINNVACEASSSDGNRYIVSDNGFRYDIQFQPGFAGDFHAISVSGGGLTFALSPDVSSRTRLAIPGLQPSRLGGDSGRLDQIASGGAYAGLGDNTSRAVRIVDEAIADVGRVQASLDGFYNASIQSASSLLGELEEDLQDSIDSIDQVDTEEESKRLAFYQDLAANGAAGLAVLNQQRAAIVGLIQHIAGLD